MADKTRKASAEDYQHYLKHGHFPNEPKPSKYGNKKVEWGGETFDSKWEWERWMVLMQMEAEGKIELLRRQMPYLLQPGFELHGEYIRPIKYIADYTYWQIEGNSRHETIEDAKGHETEVFRLKWKLLKWHHRSGNIRFVLSRKGDKPNDPTK